MIGAPSILKLTRRAAALARVLPTFALSCERKTARLKGFTIVYYESLKRELKTKTTYGYR